MIRNNNNKQIQRILSSRAVVPIACSSIHSLLILHELRAGLYTVPRRTHRQQTHQLGRVFRTVSA